MRLENGIPVSLYPWMRHLKPERLLTIGRSASAATPDIVIVAMPRSTSGSTTPGGKSMIEITPHQHATAQLGQSQQQPLRITQHQADRLVRGYMTQDISRLLGTATSIVLEKIAKRPRGRAESKHFPLGSGQFKGCLTSRS
jgi:hypothetical protein